MKIGVMGKLEEYERSRWSDEFNRHGAGRSGTVGIMA
jgi:hypothetical protein